MMPNIHRSTSCGSKRQPTSQIAIAATNGPSATKRTTRRSHFGHRREPRGELRERHADVLSALAGLDVGAVRTLHEDPEGEGSREGLGPMEAVR